jgi:hypothetical protein
MKPKTCLIIALAVICIIPTVTGMIFLAERQGTTNDQGHTYNDGDYIWFGAQFAGISAFLCSLSYIIFKRNKIKDTKNCVA